EGAPASLRAPADRFRIDVDDRSTAVAVLSSRAGVEIERGAGGSGSPGSSAGALAIRLHPPTAAAAVNAALVAAGVGVSALVPVQGTLEDVFLELVGEAG